MLQVGSKGRFKIFGYIFESMEVQIKNLQHFAVKVWEPAIE